jgi:four helix bundle protein
MNRRQLEARAATFARNVFALCATVRNRAGGCEPAGQLQRASSSTAANYRATGRSRSPKEFVSKIGTVNEESDEAVYWLEYLRDNGLASPTEVAPLYQEAKELRAIFAASYATARRNEEKRQEEEARKAKDRSRR